MARKAGCEGIIARTKIKGAEACVRLRARFDGLGDHTGRTVDGYDRSLRCRRQMYAAPPVGLGFCRMPLPRSCADQLRQLRYLPSAHITRRVVGEEGRATTAVIGTMAAAPTGTSAASSSAAGT